MVHKSATPTGQVQYGDELTYTLTISFTHSATLGLYDPLTDTTFLRFVGQPPSGVTATDHAVSGTFSVMPDQPVNVVFVVRVDVPPTAGLSVDVVNEACVYVLPGTLGTCKPSNKVSNQAIRPYSIYLPVVLRQSS